MKTEQKQQGKKWAILAKNPSGASAKELEEAIKEATEDLEATRTRVLHLQNEIKAKKLDWLAGEAVDLQGLIVEEGNLHLDINVIQDAIEKLEKALEEAKAREAKARLEAINAEIQKLRGAQEKHFKAGLKAFASASAYLASAWGFDPAHPSEFFRKFDAIWQTVGSTLHKEFAEALKGAKKPAMMVQAEIEKLNRERAEIEKRLKVGSWAETEKKVIKDDPPKVFMRSA